MTFDQAANQRPTPHTVGMFFVSQSPCLTPDQLFIRGQLKTEPEDFVVEEIPAYEPSGEGEHLFLWIQKKDISAEFLACHVTKVLGIRRDDLGVAGLKDRRAVTRQWISVPATAAAKVPDLETDLIQVLKAIRHTNKLKTGHLKGNRFELVVRGIGESDFEKAEDIVNLLAVRGVPNYFGEQRFGSDQETLQLGMSLLKGEMNPKQLHPQRRKFLLRFALSAAQSSLFNTVVARRLSQDLLHRVQLGDIMQVTASGGPFLVEDVAREQPRLELRETVITGPMFGPKMRQPQGAPAELEQSVMDEAGLTMDMFRLQPKLTSGTRRPVLIWPKDLAVKKDPNGLKLTFELPSGSYATVVLNEFLKTSSHQTELEVADVQEEG